MSCVTPPLVGTYWKLFLKVCLPSLIPPTKLGTRVIHNIIESLYFLTENYVTTFFRGVYYITLFRDA